MMNAMKRGKKKPLSARAKKLRQRMYKREYRARNKIRDIWHHLRHNAKRRKKRCVISLSDFAAWCDETCYHLLKGRSAQDATIDCIIDEVGYEKGNLQVLTRSKNSQKYNFEKYRPVYSDDEEDPF
jgi:hypothetical protein